MQNLDPRQTSCFLTAVQRGTVRATEAGDVLIAFLSKQEGALDLLQSEFDALAGMKRGNVSIAVGEGFVGDLFDNTLATFSSTYPDITFSLSIGSTEDVLHHVTSEQSHLGLAYNVPKTPRVRVQASCTQPLVGLVKRGGTYDLGHPFTLDELAAMPCAVPPKSFGIGAMITAVEAKHGVRLRAVIETGSISALKAFVRNDMGCTILPRFVVESELSAGLMVARPIPGAIFPDGQSSFPDGQSSLIRKEGRKLPQAAQLLIKHFASMSAFTSTSMLRTAQQK